MKIFLVLGLICAVVFDTEASPKYARGFRNVFGMKTAPKKLPDLCYQPKKTGPCRARIQRYYFDKKTGCTGFVYGGCNGNENKFNSMEDCKNVCKEDQVLPPTQEEKVVKKPPQNCTLEVDFLKTCEVTSSLENMILCNNVPISSDNETECLNAGCCWHPTFEVCHQISARKISSNRCTILFQDNEGFIGYASLQSPETYPHGWVGNLSFGNAVTGEFCVGKAYTKVSGIQTGQRLDENKMIMLQSKKPIYSGLVVPFVFTGTYTGATISPDYC